MGKGKRKGGKASLLVAIDVAFTEDREEQAPTGVRYNLFGDASTSDVSFRALHTL